MGALEGGIVFTILTSLDVEPVVFGGSNNEMVYLAATYGIILGGIVGGVIGLLVGVTNARGRGGLLIGSLIGVVLSIYVFADAGARENLVKILAVIILPAAASIGLVSAVLTASRREPQPSSESDKSHRIFS